MKQTRKRGALGDVAAVVAQCANASEAARRLGVNKSTISRWIASGHVPVPGSAVREETTKAEALPASDWATQYRASRALSETELELVTLAEEALLAAKDREVRIEARLSAMGRFQALVKQLAGVDAAPQAKPVTAAPAARRVVADPRRILMAVK